jgi:hypothetical protein
VTHPPNICAHCENGRDPVTNRNGYSFKFPITTSVLIEIRLHVGCADAWCRQFNFFSITRQYLDSQFQREMVTRN